jgi:hypothetical protein
MSDILPRRLVPLPGAVEGEEGDKPTPAEAVGRVLAGNPHGPRLLSRARHKVVAARNTVATAHDAARACRDAEQDYDQARREHDPNEERNRRSRFEQAGRWPQRRPRAHTAPPCWTP